MGVHVCIQMPMHVCMCAKVRSQPDVSYSGAVHLVFIDIRSLNGLARLTGQCTPGTICFCPPSTGITSAHCHAMLDHKCILPCHTWSQVYTIMSYLITSIHYHALLDHKCTLPCPAKSQVHTVMPCWFTSAHFRITHVHLLVHKCIL